MAYTDNDLGWRNALCGVECSGLGMQLLEAEPGAVPLCGEENSGLGCS